LVVVLYRPCNDSDGKLRAFETPSTPLSHTVVTLSLPFARRQSDALARPSTRADTLRGPADVAIDDGRIQLRSEARDLADAVPRARRPTIMAFAPNAWQGPRMNRQHILSRLAERGWPVHYSTGALSVWDRFSSRWEQAGWLRGADVIEGVHVDRSSRWMPRWPTHRTWDRLAIRDHVRWLKSTLDDAASPLIAYVFHPSFWPYVEQLRPRFVVFHAYDAFDLTPDWNEELALDQARLARRADLCVASFSRMALSFPDDVRSTVRELPNGADVELFTAADGCACPDDLAAIPHPRIVYAGAINRKLDFEMVADLARARPDWHWVFIGRVQLDDDAESLQDWQSCIALPNVHHLDGKDAKELPAYLHHADVNVMCYRIDGNGWWLRGSPLKLHEQLAVGRPVVGAALDAVRPFAHVLDAVRTHEEWMAAIERALSSGGVGTPAERRAVALKNSWDRRIDLLERWIFEMIESDRTAGTPVARLADR
jgi:glycosyltransferase involved in cell wall biosynthesis